MRTRVVKGQKLVTWLRVSFLGYLITLVAIGNIHKTYFWTVWGEWEMLSLCLHAKARLWNILPVDMGSKICLTTLTLTFVNPTFNLDCWYLDLWSFLQKLDKNISFFAFWPWLLTYKIDLQSQVRSKTMQKYFWQSQPHLESMIVPLWLWWMKMLIKLQSFVTVFKPIFPPFLNRYSWALMASVLHLVAFPCYFPL